MGYKKGLSASTVLLGALSGQSIAGIIIQDLDISLGGEAQLNGASFGEISYIDVNSDGQNEFQFYNYELNQDDYLLPEYSTYYSERTAYTQDRERNYLQVSGLNNLQFTADPLGLGEQIDDLSAFVTSDMLVDYYDYSRTSYQSRSRSRSCGWRGSCSYGSMGSWTTTDADEYSWLNGSWSDEIQAEGDNYTGYLGFKLTDIDGMSNFGWLSMTIDDRGEGTINSLAFNDISNQSIKAGQRSSVSVSEPSALALMVMGVGAVALRRRKQKVSKS